MNTEELRNILKEKGMDWLVAAMVDGSIGYHTPQGAKQLIEGAMQGETKSWCERCMGSDRMTKRTKNIPQILKIPWTSLESAEAEVRRIIVNQQEFYAISYAGNLLFTPEEISAAHLRFITYPNIEKTWPIWILSESDIKGVAKQFGSDIEGLDPDLIVHHFKKGFMPLVDSWDEVLKGAIEQARLEQLIHE